MARLTKVQGYKKISAFWLRCEACGKEVNASRAAAREHEKTRTHLEATEGKTLPNHAVLGADRPVIGRATASAAATTLDLQRLPETTLRELREATHMSDAQLETYSAREALDALLNFNGIIGYTDTVLGFVDELREAARQPMNDAQFSALMSHFQAEASQRGYAVIIWAPEELRDANPRRVEDRSVELGWDIINDLATEPDVTACPACGSHDTEAQDENTRICNDCEEEF